MIIVRKSMPIDNNEQYKSNKSNHWETIYIYIYIYTLDTKKLFDFFLMVCVCGYL